MVKTTVESVNVSTVISYRRYKLNKFKCKDAITVYFGGTMFA